MANSMLVLLFLVLSAGPPGRGADEADIRCGAYCLYTALDSLDLPVGGFAAFEKALGQPTNSGYSLQQLADAAERFGASTLGVQTSLDELSRREGRFACIAYLERKGHFVCVYDVDEANVFIVDPPRGYETTRDGFNGLWSGKALLISDRALVPMPPKSRLLGLAMVGALIVASASMLALLHRRRSIGRLARA